MSESKILYQKADGGSMQQDLVDIEIAKQMSAVLQQHYPGHSWGVNVNTAGGVATIMNLKLSGQWGFLLHLNAFSASEYNRRVIMAAGELLEHYNLSRGRFRASEIDALPVNSLGNAEFSI